MIYWSTSGSLDSKHYKCGYCGNPLASEKGFIGQYYRENAFIYICHHCGKPTFFDLDGKQFPGPIQGYPVLHIPDINVESLFTEAKSCFSISAYTSCVMCCRKLLMNIAVAENAPEGLNYVEYVNYLESLNYIPPKGKEWVEIIRKLGNEANHKIELKNESEAELILDFTEMLLRFIYELPGKMRSHESSK